MARILIVDDNEEVAELFLGILEEAGHQCEISGSAYGAAVRALQSTPFDLAIVDLVLAGSDGVIAALAMRGLGFAGPIVVITGNLAEENSGLYRMAKFAGRLLKPVRPAELVAEVAKHLEKKEGLRNAE